MKRLIPFLFLILLASCGEKGNSEKTTSANILENLTYSVDTVVVDSGEIFLSIANEFQLESSSSLAEDQRLFYLFSNKDYFVSYA